MFVTKFKVRTSPWKKLKAAICFFVNLAFILIIMYLVLNCGLLVRRFFNF